ncbi:MAG: glycosyltransferase [Rhodospirillaceae bacterium]|nr:glycosyltransferase [Rhodospirillaceae bacterium]
MRTVALAALVAAVLHGLVWYATHESIAPPDLEDAIESLSFNNAAPKDRAIPFSPEERADTDRDLTTVAKVSRGIRLYAATGRFEEIPPLARRHGLKVTVGAWLDKDLDYNAKEIESAIAVANRNPNVRAVVVGNEALLRGDLTYEQLVTYLRQVRKRVGVPVSTGEIWYSWIEHPKLANEVDFIAAHVLPYWEAVPPKDAVKFAVERYQDLKTAFPGKRIVIAEFGWPSRGYNRHSAEPDPIGQARILREFLAEAKKRGIEYNVVEAFDQPWKVNEGSVGPYWGIFDDDRNLKFSLFGTVERTNLLRLAALALLIGAAVSILGLYRRRPTFGHAFAFSAAANALSAAMALAAMYPIENYLNFGSALAWVIGFLLMIPLSAMTLVKVHEVAEITLGRRPQRLWRPVSDAPDLSRWPMVSIHIPAYREPPSMLIQTLNSVAALDYPNFEVLVIVNNTPEEHLWRPIEAHCAALGPRFKFVNLPKVSGFKAGALNMAMPNVAPEAEIIALLDADYVVHPRWLRDLVPAFADPMVALMQAPQDHRDGHESLFKEVMNSEYAGFFDIGMVQRNEDDAIITHGTMLMIRRSAFDEAGGWATDTITEDTELGLRLLAAGYHAQYTNRRYGWGMLPDTYKAFKTQRHRWAYGAVQIIRKHWRLMLPGRSKLTGAQRFQFVTGWSYWLSDAFGVAAAILNLIWVPVILFVGVLIPMLPFTLPILAAFFVNLLHCVVLYGTRVKVPLPQILGAAIAAMSLQLTVASAMASGFLTDSLPFLRTDKGGAGKRKAGENPAKWELILGLLLVLGSTVLVATNYTGITELNIFAATLAIQALPFLSAAGLAALERRAAAQAQKAAVVTLPAAE